MDWLKYIETAAAFTIPFATDLFNLPIFFDNWKGTYKTVASIFAASLYVSIRFFDPNTIYFPLEKWWIFFIAAFVLLITYIGLHTYNKSKIDPPGEKPQGTPVINPNADNEKNETKNSILILGLVIFSLMYASLTTGFSLLFQSLNYELVKCRVIDDKTKNPIPDVEITLRFMDEKNNSDEDDAILNKTNSNGKTQRYISKEKLDLLKLYNVVTEDAYRNLNNIEINKSRLIELQNIYMTKL